MSMSSHFEQPMPSAKRGQSRPPAEEWQLRILSELHKKQPRPSVEQKKLLAVQTGLNAKWIASWFKRVNGAPKKSLVTRTVTPPTVDGSDSKSTNLTEPIPSEVTSLLSSVVETRPLFCRLGVVSESASAGISSPRTRLQTWDPVETADLRENRDCPVFGSHLQSVWPALTPRLQLAPLHSQQTVNLPGTTPIQFPSSFQPGSPPSSVAKRGHPYGPHGLPDPLQIRHFGPQPAVLAFTEHPKHCIGPGVACMPSHTSAHDPTASQPSLIPLPSIYWLLFDTDDNSVDVPKNTSHSPSGLSCGAVIAMPRANPTPISFLARWTDVLAVERRIRSSFNTSLLQVKQAQASETTRIERGDREVSWTVLVGRDNGDKILSCIEQPRSKDTADKQQVSPASSLSSVFGEQHDEVTPDSYSLLSDPGIE
ncbi:hypothetical protein B0F90DRAFT_1815778 [Multifurca ochricompacta]|uniref:Homeobox domain-containing protein n=1 Tax=Multifurca ochricompacta TaxID=376703 RepID=A0AAD4M7P8_9AGAM|nr:hypothetical protein B0F90DRAFT_1815778 [Multifurca ochricompacta]